MTAVELGTVAGYGLMLWAIGFCAGALFRSTRQVIERATGLGS